MEKNGDKYESIKFNRALCNSNKRRKVIDKFYETVDKFIVWICHKFGIGESKELVRNFEKETHTFIDPVKQLKHEEQEKEWNLEI